MTPPVESPRGAGPLPRESGGFRMLRVLGRGGMGIVYEAEELASGRRVALKVLAEELSVSEEAFERFRREARIAASVSDSGCVFVFGAHQIDGAPAIAMELCAGETLEHRLARKEPIPIGQAVRWAIEILDGLEAAHRSGIVHRDVKPSNCFITADGRIKVGDFGLARSLERDVQLTRSGVFLGSPLYASPEQVKGRQVDLRSDLYSVGATLFAVLTGRSPYHGDNLGEVLARILSEPPDSPRALRPDVPRGLEKVILRAMARDPEQRFQSHAEMRAALEAFAGRAHAAASRRRRFFAYLVDVGVLALLQIPLMGLWRQFDPDGVQAVAGQPWRLRSEALMLTAQALSFLYYAVSEGLFQRSIGKWITGQRVVLVGDATHGVLLRTLRGLVWTAPGILSVLLGVALDGNSVLVRIGLTFLPMAANFAMLATMRRRNGWRGVHELASRTRVVAEPLLFGRFARHRPPPASRLEPSDLFPARLGEYATVGRVGRTATGEIFEASDTGLDRRVWIHLRDPAAPPLAVERRSLERERRLRWLAGFEDQGRRHEVFEAPGGALLRDCCAGTARLPWATTHGMLAALADELAGDPPPRLSLEQLWIDRSWTLRILDEPLGDDAGPAREPLELLALAASASLAGAPGPGDSLPLDLPVHAEPAARRLLGLDAPFASVPEARQALAESARRPQALSRKIRGLQLLLGSGLWAALCCFIIVSGFVIALPQAREMAAMGAMIEELEAGRAYAPGDLDRPDGKPTGPELDAEGVRARSILCSQVKARNGRFGNGMQLTFDPEEEALLDRLEAEYGASTPAEIAAARAHMDAEHPTGFVSAQTRALRIFGKMTFVMPFFFSVIWAVVAVLGAFLLRGGPSLWLASLAVRDPHGRRAGRLRCAWRALLAALPFLALYAPPFFLVAQGKTPLAAGALVVAVLVHAALAAVALRDPARGWHDRLARTRLVPR